eukprot:14233415-Ditylum_brightwellii.AAC.1
MQCPKNTAITDSIKVQLRETQVEIRKLIRESAKKREVFNRKLAEIYALTGKTTTKKALKSIINAEQMKKIWKKIGYADKKKEMGSITSLQIPVTWLSPDVEVDT